ncbi:sulfurtransferase [Azoarcus sp. DD4]|uniref:rhodanese-like domain-containing protein n=1 Tax=Azoarcus sp. DD4 TaxID=2027405 RepID=UPI00112ECE0E|nr:rhodanese-like domain-containing protein [Azoarcus sp. DD4]QDF95972.1 sulfurtransferase [Azoarcus sp. DD4]
MHQITPVELAEWLADPAKVQPLLLDVREPWEFQLCHIEGSTPMPMGAVPARIAELDPERVTVVVCHHGGRSAQVGMFLERQGFGKVINLAGGVAEWAARVDPKMPHY